MGDTLEERLRSHTDAFNSLLSLIPAKTYYGPDSTDQWRRTKQTKEQARAAKIAKLNPANFKSAKDILDEKEKTMADVEASPTKKRKRSGDDSEKSEYDEREDDDDGQVPGMEKIELEKPKEGMKYSGGRPEKKKPKKDTPAHQGGENRASNEKAKADKQREKKEKKSAKLAARLAKKQAKKEKERAMVAQDGLNGTVLEMKSQEASSTPRTAHRDANGQGAEYEGVSNFESVKNSNAATNDGEDNNSTTDIQLAGGKALVASQETEHSHEPSRTSATPSSKPQSPIFDPSYNQSGISSISSAPPIETTATNDPTTYDIAEKLETGASVVPAKPSPEELKQRLLQRLEELRAARKADNEDGTPVRTRQDLIEARRKKQEKRKERKKQLQQQAKEEELRQKEIALSHGSPLLSPSGASPLRVANNDASGSVPSSNHPVSSSLAFGRVAFDDGTTMDPSLSQVVDPRRGKKKGPSDPYTALLHADAQAAKLAAMDPAAREAAEEKERWLAIQRRARGERVRLGEAGSGGGIGADSEVSLLKKALKRKERGKRKSEREWAERTRTVERAVESKQRKREENLKKRREEKGSSKKGGAGSKKKGSSGGAAAKGNKSQRTKRKARPGFEGSFRAGGLKGRM